MPQIIQHPVVVSSANRDDVPSAQHLSTTYTDDLCYPVSNIADIAANIMVPNKFRLRARVKAIFPRNPPTGTPPMANYICFFCKKCERPYVYVLQPISSRTLTTRDNAKTCHGCKDTILAEAELRYRFIAILEQNDNSLTVLISDRQADEFLPPLPPLSPTNNPNDLKKIENRTREANEKVEQILLGAMMDGQRSRPVIDWTVECYAVKNGKKGAKGEVVVYSVFGMKSS